MKDGDQQSARIKAFDIASRKASVIAEKPGQFLWLPRVSPNLKWVSFQLRPTSTAASEQLFVAPITGSLPVDPSRWIPVTSGDFFLPVRLGRETAQSSISLRIATDLDVCGDSDGSLDGKPYR